LWDTKVAHWGGKCQAHKIHALDGGWGVTTSGHGVGLRRSSKTSKRHSFEKGGDRKKGGRGPLFWEKKKWGGLEGHSTVEISWGETTTQLKSTYKLPETIAIARKGNVEPGFNTKGKNPSGEKWEGNPSRSGGGSAWNFKTQTKGKGNIKEKKNNKNDRTNREEGGEKPEERVVHSSLVSDQNARSSMTASFGGKGKGQKRRHVGG